MNPDDVILTLNALTTLCFDGEAAFGYCARRTGSAPLRQLFRRRALDCQGAARSLQRQVQLLGGEPCDHGSAAGEMHLSYVAVRCALTDDPDRVLLEACEHGDALTLRWYRGLLLLPLPQAVRLLVAAQHDAVACERSSLAVLRERRGSLV